VKRSELLKTISGVGPCFIGEYRGSMVEKVQWVDKKDGKAHSFISVTHQFEFGTGQQVQQIKIDERFPETVREVGDVQVKFKRGSSYFLLLGHFERFKRNLVGKLDPSFEPVEIED